MYLVIMGIDISFQAVKNGELLEENAVGFRQWHIYPFVAEHCEEAKIINNYLKKKDPFKLLNKIVNTYKEPVISEPKQVLGELVLFKDAIIKSLDKLPKRDSLLVNGKKQTSFTGYTEDAQVIIHGKIDKAEIRPLLLDVTEKNLDATKKKLMGLYEVMEKAAAGVLKVEVNRQRLHEKAEKIKEMSLGDVRKDYASLFSMADKFQKSARTNLLDSMENGKLMLYSKLDQDSKAVEPVTIEQITEPYDITSTIKCLEDVIRLCEYAIEKGCMLRSNVS
jgi:hypothetical protein